MNLVQYIAVAALPLLFAITVHEVAHGFVAYRLGDPTAMMLGRLTLNPIKHIDPVGTVVVPLMLLMLGGFIFGWAKPVPVTAENLKQPKRDMALVAAAGPAANLLMAAGWALMAKLGFLLGSQLGWAAQPLILMGEIGIRFNLILMVLNLLPIPPLDGGRVLVGLLPGPLSWQVSRIEPYGFLILLLLLASPNLFGVNLLGMILGPPMKLIETILYSLFGL